MKNLNYPRLLLIKVLMLSFVFSYAQNENTVLSQKTEKKKNYEAKRAQKKIKLGLEFGIMKYTEASTIKAVLSRVGYGDDSDSFLFYPPYQSTASLYISLTADYKVRPNMAVGIKFRHTANLKIDAYKELYRAEDNSNGWFPSALSRGHSISENINLSIIEPKIEWLSKNQVIAFSGGPSFAYFTESPQNANWKLGFWTGASLTGFIKTSTFVQLNMSYHLIGKYRIPEESFSTTNEDTGLVYNSNFPGIGVSFSHILLGFKIGVLF